MAPIFRRDRFFSRRNRWPHLFTIGDEIPGICGHRIGDWRAKVQRRRPRLHLGTLSFEADDGKEKQYRNHFSKHLLRLLRAFYAWIEDLSTSCPPSVHFFGLCIKFSEV